MKTIQKLKNIFHKFQELRKISDTQKFNEEMIKIFSVKRFIIVSAIGNISAYLFYLAYYNEKNLDVSLGRGVSRRVGLISNVTIPDFMKDYLYGGYMKMYNVNKEEILDQNLKNYKNIREFFIRKIDVYNYLKYFFR
jgi:hypothetical protein